VSAATPDFLIVGAGAAGGVVAKELATAGFRVVVLEQGPWLRERDFQHDELWSSRRHALFGGNLNEWSERGGSRGLLMSRPGSPGTLALLTDWKSDFGLPDDAIKGAVLSSGLYDLKAVRLSARSKYVAFTDDIEQRFSTQRHIDRIRTPLVLAHGSYETPEFKRQTRDFAKAVEDAGKPCQFFVNENYNHFEMMETFGNPYGLLGRAVVTQMELPG